MATGDPTAVRGAKQMYITGEMVREHGGTKGCIKCDGKYGPHTPACRARFEKLFKRIEERRGEQQPTPAAEAAEDPNKADGA